MNNALAINLRRLRKLKKINQSELAEMAGISRNAYRSIETGKSEPRSSTLHSIARALGVTVFDLLAEIPTIRSLRFRAQLTMTAWERAEREQIAVDVARWLDDFNDIEKINGDHTAFMFEGMPFEGEYPESAAARAREALRLDEDEYINDICSLLEKAGIKIRLMSSNLKKFFGLSVGAGDGGPAIAVNTDGSIPVERQIFTTAHEFGHLLLHSDSYRTEEVEEDDQQENDAILFASFFIIAQANFAWQWSDSRGMLCVYSVLIIKRLFNVSYKTVLYRLVDEGITDIDIYWKFTSAYERRYDRKLTFKEEPEIYLTRGEEPLLMDRLDFVEDRLARLVMNALDDELISMSRAAEILNISVSEMRERVVEWEMFDIDRS